MHQVADGVWHLALMPRDAINAYLVGDVLVDAGVKQSGPKILRALQGRAVSAHAITHGHLDHAGSSKRVCETLAVPCWAPARDAAAIRSGQPEMPDHTRLRPLLARSRFPGVEVARELREGDEVAGFRVIDAPGHSPGHIALWRESDRVLIGGDAFFNMHPLTTRPGLRQPPGPLTSDPVRNRASMRMLANLEPALALFGHGPPVHDAAAKLRACVDALPADR